MLGGLSAFFERDYPGIAVQAGMGTLAVFVTMFVTLMWIYLEMLRLLAKLRGR